MKKLIPLLFVLAILASLFTAAIADEEAPSPRTLNWITARRSIVQNNLNGSYYVVEDFNTDIWIPDFLSPMEEIPEGWYYVFTNEDNSVSVKARKVLFDGDCTLEGLEEAVKNLGRESDGIYWINGYDVVIYENKEEDSLTVGIPYEEGYVLEFIFAPVSVQEVYSLASIIMSTIQPHSLSIRDVALMIDADLNYKWGKNKDVRYSEDGSGITIFLWDDGITSEVFKNINNWDALKEEKVNLYNTYVSVLEEFNMSSDVPLTLKYISYDEDISFLSISGGEIVYDAAQ